MGSPRIETVVANGGRGARAAAGGRPPAAARCVRRRERRRPRTATVDRAVAGPLLSALFAVLMFALPAFAQEPFKVVVHSSNPVSALSKAEAAKIFLKKSKSWDHGLGVVAVDQAPSRSVRQSFSREVHGKEVAWIKSYWQKMIFSGRATPPPELGSDREVLEFVKNNAGAVGYVSANASLGSGVKKIEIEE